MVEVLTRPAIQGAGQLRGTPDFLEIDREGLLTDSPPYIGQRVFDFLRSADSCGAITAVKDSSTEDQWLRITAVSQLNILTDAMLGEISSRVGFNRVDAAGAIWRRFIRNVYKYSPEGLRQEYSLEELTAKKRLSQRHRDNISRLRGGRRKEVREFVSSNGVLKHPITRSDVARHLHMDPERAHTTLKYLRRAGHAPESSVVKNKRITDLIENAQNVDDYRALLRDGSISYYFVRTHKDLFVSLQKIARCSGYAFKPAETTQFALALGVYGEPYLRTEANPRKGESKTRICFYGFSARYDDILEAFSRNRKLDKFKRPVR